MTYNQKIAVAAAIVQKGGVTRSVFILHAPGGAREVVGQALVVERGRLAFLLRRSPLGCVERVDKVLESRMALFATLRQNLANFKGKLESA